MTTVRIALANLERAATPGESVLRAARAVREAATARASIVCFPEGFVPGYRGLGLEPPPPDAAWLERAWTTIAAAVAEAKVGVILGTERIVNEAVRLTSLVINPDGSRAGFQDKVQLDPTEESTYAAGADRRVFTMDALTFGVVICCEGWRYPETVRAAARQGAQIVFHPHLHVAEPGDFAPSTFLDPRNSFHEKAMLCRAAENTCYFASVNCASAGSGTTSAVIRPDGSVLAYQPYGVAGLLVADVDLTAATRLLASRCRS
jgi:predicted amidohydrolase